MSNEHKLYETLEAVAIAQGMKMLIEAAERHAPASNDPAMDATLKFFRAIHGKYSRKANAVKFSFDAFGGIEVFDVELHRFNTN